LNSYKNAIAAYDTAVGIMPQDSTCHSNRGYAFIGLGDLHASLSEPEEASNCYREAVAACEEALRLSPGSIAARDHLSAAQSRL
jgi:tetratricopeptide (TPR) repeat protein